MVDQIEELPETNLEKINIYTCNKCGESLVTIDKAIGVTPFQLACRITKNCKGSMLSHGYKVDQSLVPTHEWYKQNLIMATKATREHIRNGGLSLNRIAK